MPFSQSLLSAAGSTQRIAQQQVNSVSISANSHSCADPASMCAAVQVIAVSLFQCGMAWAVRNCSWGTIFGLGWAVSGFCNQNLFCAQHELSHFLAFKKPSHNKLLSILSNCPLVVPTATTFRKYHQEHHSHLVRSVIHGCPFSANCVCAGAPEACAAFPASFVCADAPEACAALRARHRRARCILADVQEWLGRDCAHVMLQMR